VVSDPVPVVRPRARKMYVDIDGVLVVWDRTHNCTELARGLGRLMRFCKLHQIQPYWLTLWSREPATLAGVSCLLTPSTASSGPMARPPTAC
jgi:hypothetical protein